MLYKDLHKAAFAQYGPALHLRSVLPRAFRNRIETIVSVALMVLFVVSLLGFAISTSSIQSLPGMALVHTLAYKAYGLFLIVFAVRFIFTALEAFHRSYYFHGLETLIAEGLTREVPPLTWEVATIIADTHRADVLKSFLESSYGQETLYRAGVVDKAFDRFYTARTPHIDADTFFIERDHGVTLGTYARSLYKHDQDFARFLNEQNIRVEQLVASADWVTKISVDERKRARWWSRDSLGRIPGLGKTWSYGESTLLQKYGHEISEDPVWQAAVESITEEHDEVEDLEEILARASQANALLIGPEGSGKRERVAQLYYKIREGKVLPQLEAKRIFYIDPEAIFSSKREKGPIEEEVRRVFDQGIRAGNIVIYIEHLHTTIASATTLGVDLVDLLAPYFGSNRLQLICSSDLEGFHRSLARDSRVMQYFEVVHMKETASTGLIGVLEQRASTIEKRRHITFTHPSLDAIARMADRYFPDGVMPDKAFDLMEELVPIAQEAGIEIIGVADAEELVSKKTGVPIGTPSDEERNKLLKLEDFLHQRVVGQESAVEAVARALRRARAGVGKSDKPMGSYLFLGPTGVGKTETAKALAVALFNDEEAMIRFDMSEFQGADALDRMIGSMDGREPGRLATAIREHQYGVLLLDEFEKSTRNVHDLFLQVLDEGQFTDAMGKRVNARNLIIIATSNAGADLIWSWEKENKNLVELKRTLIDELINRGLFRPEFLNRFDDVVLFHPLAHTHVVRIARIQLELLAKRLLDQGIELIVTDELVDAVAAIGYDPQFGGRPMNRAIKNKVEQAVADRLLAGTLKPGMRFELSKEEINAIQ